MLYPYERTAMKRTAKLATVAAASMLVASAGMASGATGTLDPGSGFVTIYFRNARTVSSNPR